MIKNYLKIAWRNLLRNKVYSTINIVGLTIGLCACMLVATVVTDDLSYDTHWSKANYLYRIIMVNKMGNGLYDRSSSSIAGLGNKLKEFPQVRAVAEVNTLQKRFKLNEDDTGVNVTTLTADTAFWQMFDTQIIAGNPKKYIEGSNNIVITESFSSQFFQNENPVGKIIYDIPDYGNKKSYLITGIIKDLPSNTVLRSQVILLQKDSKEVLRADGSGSYLQQFVLFKPNTNIIDFGKQLNHWYRNFTLDKKQLSIEFQPIKDVYLHSDFAGYQLVKGSYKNIYIFSGVALLLLIISCVNFINLSTAKATERIKETGVRKVLGAARNQLILQFIIESLLVFFLAAILSTIVYQIALPMLENYIGHRLQVTFISRLYLLLTAYGTMLCISALAGIYPAWILSSFKPAATLKNNLFSNSPTQNIVKKSLVVVQFSISLIVLIALIVVQQQLDFLKQKDLGYNKNNLLNLNFVSFDGKAQYFKNELLKNPGVVSASIANWAPAQGPGSMSTQIEDPNNAGNKINVWFINADLDFAETMGIHLQSGRLLSSNFAADVQSQDSLMQIQTRAKYEAAANRQSSLVTEYTAKLLRINQLNSPIKQAHTNPVGIIKNFNNESLKDPIQPTIIVADNTLQFGDLLIRIVPGTETSVEKFINNLWKQTFPEELLQMDSVSNLLADQYKEESKLQQLLTFFGSLSMLLALLGVFGLVVQATQQRTKEISIRKILGASVSGIVRLLSQEYLKLVFVAFIIASPIVWRMMHKWLQDFPYRITIQWWMFASAGIVAIVLALLATSFQAVKAALANPVKSLRSE